MDLGAYENIEKLSAIAKENGIEIPRLCGYRLMKNEKPFPQDRIDKAKDDCATDVVERLCMAIPFWDPKADCHVWSNCTDYVKDYYITKKDGEYISIRWDRIHGWKRKVLKLAIKKQKQAIQKQWDMWNKYAGQENVLYIHSRMGSNNWFDLPDINERAKIVQAPWFLGRVDDYYDNTYCDFYARIK